MRDRFAGRCGLLTTALLALVAACGPAGDTGPRPKASESGSSSPGARTTAALRAAQLATDGAAAAKVHSTTVMGTQLSLAADGALRWSDGVTGTLTITYTGGTTAETMRGLGVTSMEARYLPEAYYAHMGDAFAAKTGGRHWIRYAYDDLDALDALDGTTGATFADQVRNASPGQAVKLLLHAHDVRGAGSETVAGRRTKHYSGTVDVADVSDAGLKRQLELAGVTGETVDLWVDDRNLLVKKVEKGRTASGAYIQTAYYSDYGTTVAVEVPPAADTTDFTELTA